MFVVRIGDSIFGPFATAGDAAAWGEGWSSPRGYAVCGLIGPDYQFGWGEDGKRAFRVEHKEPPIRHVRPEPPLVEIT